MEQLRTAKQSRVLFALLSELGLTDQRADLVHQYTQGRTDSTKGLSMDECQCLIDDLQVQVNKKKKQGNVSPSVLKKRRAFCAVCHKLGWETSGGKLDYPRINSWLLKYSYLKKELNKYNDKELIKLIAQVDKMLELKNKKANGKVSN